jgi:3-oxoacyl-[acyl-carrier-protein] synthase II
MSGSNRRVVVTGMGLISPLGNSCLELWDALKSGRSGVRMLERVPSDYLTTDVGGDASTFTGDIENFGELEKQTQRSIKKGLKLMCRDIQMGVAAAQLALHDAGLDSVAHDATRIGTMFGSDYIVSEPAEFSAGIANCRTDNEFQFKMWGQHGTPQVEPLWLLKYLPNMPASHVAIYNDLRGPSNSVTLREASSNLSVAEAVTTIRRGSADAIVVGSTGSRIHPLRTIHIVLQEQCAAKGSIPASASRPFDARRTGMVIGEGAGVLILEEFEFAQRRGAKILAEVIGYGSSTVADRYGVANYRQAFINVIDMALELSGLKPDELGHVHAHGLSTVHCDAQEATAIRDRLGNTPVTAAKSYMGNLGAGSGMVEMIASILALQNNQLFPILNYEYPDPACPINAVTTIDAPPGDSFINLNCSPQGQASAIVMQRVNS